MTTLQSLCINSQVHPSRLSEETLHLQDKTIAGYEGMSRSQSLFKTPPEHSEQVW